LSHKGYEELSQSDPDDASGFGLPLELPTTERNEWLKKQERTEWNYFAKGKLILKRGTWQVRC